MRNRSRAWGGLLAAALAAAAHGTLAASDAALPTPLQGKILSVDTAARQVEVNRGSQQGVVPKMIFHVYGEPDVLHLPLTGKDVVHLPKEVGQIRVLDVSEKTCRGEIFAQDVSLIRKDAVVIGYPVPVRSQLKPLVKALEPSVSGTVAAGARLSLAVSAQDPDGDALMFRWSCSGGRLSASRTVEPSVTWTAPVAPGEYRLGVVAIDPDRFESDPFEIKVTIAPYPEERHKTPFAFHRLVNPTPFFEGVSGLAVDRWNGLYVVDPEAQQIRKVEPDGVTVKYFGERGSDPGKFDKPARATCSGDFLYVLDKGRGKVVKFNLRGGFLKEYGEKGTGSGQFASPEDVAVAANGDIFVADAETARVLVFSDQGRFLFSLGQRGTQPGALDRPVALAVDRQGALYVLDAGRQAIVVFDRDLRFRGREIKVGAASDFDLDPTQAIAYVLFPEEKTVKKLLLAEGRFDPAFKAGGPGEGWGLLGDPVAVVCDPFGDVLVADAARRGRGLQRFNDQGVCVARLGGESYRDVMRIAAAPDGDVYCLSRGGVIRRLTPSGWTVARFGGEEGPGGVRRPMDLLVGLGGDLYVLDGDSRQIRRFKSDGSFAGDFIQASDAKQLKRLLDEPTDLAAFGDALYVMDSGEYRVQIVGPDGSFREGIDGSDGKKKESYLRGAEFLAVDPASGKVVVALSTSLKVFDANRAFVEEWGKKGSENGQFRRIAGLAFDPTGDLWVLDGSRGDLQRFRFGAPANPFLSLVKDDGRLPAPVDFAVTAFNEIWVWDKNKEWAAIFVQE